MTALSKCTTIDSPVGELWLLADDLGLREIRFESSRFESAVRRKDVPTEPDHPILQRSREQLAEYFAGGRREFTLPLAPAFGTPFQRRVWDLLKTIPYAETWSYQQLAEHAGNAKASRAVGAANGRNPLPIVVPCHRVVGKSGRLVGFGGGLDAKQLLIELERRHANAHIDGALFG